MIDIIVAGILFLIGCFLVPYGSFRCGANRKWEPSLFSGLSLASFYTLWWAWHLGTSHILLNVVIVAYCFAVYVVGVLKPTFFSVDHRINFIVLHSSVVALSGILVYYMGYEYAVPLLVDSLDKGNTLRVLTSLLSIISFISIAVSVILSWKIGQLEGRHERAILICGYGFLAISCYCLGYVGALLESISITALCFVLSGLFGFFFGIIISLVGSFNIYMFSFSVQALLGVGYFVASNLVELVLIWI